MKLIPKLRKHDYLKRVSVFLIAIALIAGTVSCEDDGVVRYTLTMAENPPAGGTATDLTGGSPYLENASVNITATANPGYLFTNWSAPAGAFGNATAATTTFTMPAQNVIVTANFVSTLSMILDHFTVYDAVSTTEWLNITDVHLEDQFGNWNATILEPWAFFNPAEKQHEGYVTPILNTTHHFTVYGINYTEMPQVRQVEVYNQFGRQNLTVGVPVALAVPTQKEGHAKPVDLDHYLLYFVENPEYQNVYVNLTDQWGGEEVLVQEHAFFANPVKKTYKGNVTDIVNPDVHGVIYDFVGIGWNETQISVDNQFGNQTLNVTGPYCMFVPSAKVVPPTTEIRVGLVRDLSGPLAFYDMFFGGPVYRAFNKTLSAGINMTVYNATLPVELIIRPYNFFLPGDLATQTQALITVDKVHFIWGAPGIDAIRVQAPICTANKIILTVLEGGSSNLTNKLPVWPYVFIHMGFAAWYQIPVLYNMLKEQSLPGNRTPKAWVLYINNEHGQEYLNVTQTIFGAGNVTAVGHTGVADQAAIDTIVNQAITALNQSGSGPDYDVFCAFTYDPFLSMVMTAFDSTGFDPPGIIMGPGANIGYYEFVNGPMMEGIMVFAVANNKTVITENVTMSMQTMFDLVGAEGAVGPPWWSWDPWGNPTIWAGLEMWKVAVETVGELNSGYSDRVRNILAGFNQTNPCTTVIGDTWYWMASSIGGGLMDYMCMPGQIGQWQNLTGNLYVEIVGASNVTALIPKYSATENVTYPMTGLWNWL